MILPYRPRLCPSSDPCESLLAPRAYFPGSSSFSSLFHSPLATYSLTPLFATDPKKHLLSPMIATLPKRPEITPVFATHPSPPGGGSFSFFKLSIFNFRPLPSIPFLFTFLRTLLSNGQPVSAFLSITCELFSSRRRVWGVCSAYPHSPIPYPLSFRTLCQKHPGVGVFLILQTFNFQLSTFNLEGRLVD